jgi:nucleoside-diphosphate-sugar epimerase
MRVLITGGAGFIGSHLVEQFPGQAEVRAVERLFSAGFTPSRNFHAGLHATITHFHERSDLHTPAR